MSTAQPVGSGLHGLMDYAEVDRTLNRGLGVGSILFMVVAAAAPMSVVAGSMPVLIGVSDSTGMPVYYLMSTLVLILFSVGYVSMSKYVRNAGAFYSYVQAGLGRMVGVGASALAVLAYLALNIGVYAYFGIAGANLVESLTGGAVDLPWWLFSLVCVAVVAVLGYRDITLSSKVLGLVLVAETLIVLVMDFAVIGAGGADGLSLESLSPMHLTDAGAPLGIMFAILGFIGFEATAVFRHEARDPDRTIPRATYLSAAVIGLFYTFSAWAIINGVGGANAVAMAVDDPEGFVLNIGATYLGDGFSLLMQIFLVSSTFACALAFHNVMTRYGFSLARNGILPQRLSQVHAVHKSPSAASVAVSVASLIAMVAVALSGLDPLADVYTPAVGLATLAYIVLMALTSISVVAFFARDASRRETFGVGRSIIAPLLSAVAFVVLTVLVTANIELLVGDLTVGLAVIAATAFAFLIGMTVAVLLRTRRAAVYEGLLDI